jgi:hypothetical protein
MLRDFGAHWSIRPNREFYLRRGPSRREGARNDPSRVGEHAVAGGGVAG